MKKSKSNTLNRPVDISTIKTSNDDCFGSWENTHKECVSCTYYEVCMVATLKVSPERKNTVKKSNHFFDELDWKAVPWNDILEQVKQNPGTIEVSDLRSTVKQLAKVIDDTTVIHKVNNWLFDNKIKTKNGCLYLS